MIWISREYIGFRGMNEKDGEKQGKGHGLSAQEQALGNQAPFHWPFFTPLGSVLFIGSALTLPRFCSDKSLLIKTNLY